MHNTLFDRIGILENDQGVRANPHVLNKPICHTMSVPISWRPLTSLDAPMPKVDAKNGYGSMTLLWGNLIMQSAEPY